MSHQSRTWSVVIFLAAVAVVAAPAAGMDQPILGGASDDLSDTATEYNRINGSSITGSWTGTKERTYVAVPANVSGKFKNLKVHLTAAPGAGKSYAFTLMVDGVASALTCTVSDTATDCSDATNQVSVTEKQTLSLRSVPTGTPAVADATWSMLWEGTNAIVLGGTPGNLSTTATQYINIMGDRSSPTGTLANALQLNATAGTLRNLYVAVNSTTPPDNGAGTQSYTFTVLVDGVTSGITCTISETATSCEDATNTKALTGGEDITLEIAPSGSPTASADTWWGMEFVPTTNGESPLWGGSDDTKDATLTEYNFIQGKETFSTTEADVYQLNQVFTIRDLYVKAAGAPGSGTSNVITVRTSDGGDTLLACTISDTATTCNDTADDISITDADNRLSISIVPSGSPSAQRHHWGTTAFIAPAAAGRKRVIQVD